MSNNEYDIIIVGAGCAGPAAAKKAAELGIKNFSITLQMLTNIM